MPPPPSCVETDNIRIKKAAMRRPPANNSAICIYFCPTFRRLKKVKHSFTLHRRQAITKAAGFYSCRLLRNLPVGNLGAARTSVIPIFVSLKADKITVFRFLSVLEPTNNPTYKNTISSTHELLLPFPRSKPCTQSESR
jgi:hypothetical protein